MDAKRLGKDAHQAGSTPVERMLPTNKSIGDLTIVARLSSAQKAFEARIALNSTLISKSLERKTSAIRLISSGSLLKSETYTFQNRSTMNSAAAG